MGSYVTGASGPVKAQSGGDPHNWESLPRESNTPANIKGLGGLRACWKGSKPSEAKKQQGEAEARKRIWHREAGQCRVAARVPKSAHCRLRTVFSALSEAPHRDGLTHSYKKRCRINNTNGETKAQMTPSFKVTEFIRCSLDFNPGRAAR